MAKAKLIRENDLERVYEVFNNTLITLKMEDDFSEITFYKSDGTKLDGEFCFEDEQEMGREYLLKRMYVPSSLKRSGIGRAVLEFFKEYVGAEIYARSNDGIDRGDGSHLTEDAPGFVYKMIKEGLLQDTELDY